MAEQVIYRTFHDMMALIRQNIRNIASGKPMCKFCGSIELAPNQGVMDSYCQECGRWQDGGEYLCSGLKCAKQLTESEVFEFEGEEKKPYCQECYEELREKNES